MRILHFYKTYITESKGGVEQFIYQLIRGVAQQGIDSDVLTLSANKQSSTVTLEGHTVYRAAQNFQLASTGFSLSAFSQFRELAKAADIIHYHFPWPFMDLVHLITKPKKPSVVTYHSDIVRQKNLLKIYKPIMNAFLQQVDKIVCTSPQYVETSPVLKKFAAKTEVVPIGIEDTTVTPNQDRIGYWQKLIKGRFYLFIGMLRYYKGLHYLLNALSSLDYPLYILGAGPEEEQLRALAQQLKLKNIYFLGSLSDEDKKALLSLAYAFVFPSHLRSEAFGISLLEAAMYGKPLISCEIGTGTTYINIDKQTGLVVPPANVQALEWALKSLWENPDRAAQFGQNARLRYQQLFSVDKMSSGYSKIYQSLCYEPR